MRLEISSDEARLLKSQLARQLEEIRGELNHDHPHDLHDKLAHDAERLRALESRLERLLRMDEDVFV